MKLTWFGGTTLRIHIGGEMLVIDPSRHDGIEPQELVSGADQVLRSDGVLPEFDPSGWKPRRRSPLDDMDHVPVAAYRLEGRSVLIDAAGEPPLILAATGLTLVARWTADAVVVVFDAASADAALERLQPRLIAVAADVAVVDAAFGALADRLAGTSLVALEPGLALEV